MQSATVDEKMVVGQILFLYRDENDLLRTVTKRIYEEWNSELKQWRFKKIEYIFADPEFPEVSDNIEVAVETQHGWLIPPEWKFIAEEWVYTRKPAVNSERRGHTYNHEGEVGIIKE